MSGFSAEWLALREPFDIAARDDELANSFLAYVAQEAQEAPESQEAPGAPGAQGAQVTQGPEGLQLAQVTEEPEGLQIAKVTQGSEGLQLTQVTKEPEKLQLAQVTKGPEGLQMAKVTKGLQVAQATQGLPGALAGPVVDLGAGAGSNISRLRSLAAKLGYQLSWRHVDNDAALLAVARERFGSDGAVTISQLDIFLALDAALQGAAAVTCAALLDLVSAAWIDRLADHLARERLPLLALLTYDGRMQWSLADAADAVLTRAFHRDMLSDKGFGPALGPAAAFALAAALAERGAATQLRDSFWRIAASDRPMLSALNASLSAAALRGAHGQERAAIEAWSARRTRQIADAEVSLVVGHQELLATWP
jgi:hypothetical protein